MREGLKKNTVYNETPFQYLGMCLSESDLDGRYDVALRAGEGALEGLYGIGPRRGCKTMSVMIQ